MKYQSVDYRKDESIAQVILNRPESQNAINLRMASDLAGIMDEIKNDNDVKVVIVTGAGKEFCLGTDQDDLHSGENRERIRNRLTIGPVFHMFDRPIIAALNGDAMGQGLELALCCDLRICTKKARFALSQVTNGEIPWDGGTQRLARLVGRGPALEMILTGGTIEADEAFRIGLVNKVVPDEKLRSEAMDLARQMAGQGPIALRYAKEAIFKGMDLTLEQGLRLEADLYFLLHTTRDRREGINAFREKRAPKFEGE